MPNPFAGPSYTLALRKADIQRSVNMYLVGMEAPGKAPFVLDSVPGYSLFSNLGAVIRGRQFTNDRAFFVAGSILYELTSTGVMTSRGTLSTATGYVEMEYGVTQLVLVDGANGYVLTLATNVFSKITSSGFYGSNRVEFLDNYFLFLRPGTGQFYISAINNASSEDPLAFATAESAPDNLVAILAVQRRLLLFGQYTIEIWFNSGNVDFPFQREGTTIEVGCIAAHSARTVDNTAFWIGQDKNGSGVVYRLQGYQAMRISTQAIEQAIQASSDLSSAVCYAYQENGLTFYAINAPGLTSTWVYEVASGAWHERCDLDSMGRFKADRGVCHMAAFGYHLIGGSDGVVYKLDRSVYTKNGNPLVRERTSPHSSVPSLKYQFFDHFFLDCTTGEAPQAVDPVVTLSWSGDSGATWRGNRQKSTGKVGERFARIPWKAGLGRSRDRVWKVRFSDNAPFAILNADIGATEGSS